MSRKEIGSLRAVVIKRNRQDFDVIDNGFDALNLFHSRCGVLLLTAERQAC